MMATLGLAFIINPFYNGIMNQSLQLHQLQQIDTQLLKVNTRITEINAILEKDQTIQEAEKVLAETKNRYEKSRLVLKRLEDSVQAQQIKIEVCDSSLYSGRIQNPKELKDLQDDLVSLKKHLSSLEDQQLEAMLAFEQLEHEMAQSNNLLNQAKARFIEMQSTLLGEKSHLENVQVTLVNQREVILNAITPENLNVYSKLLKNKRGLAVSQIIDNTCTACGTSIRPAELQAARSPSQIVFCSSCGRILYAG
jgi:uncharacterized protein